MHEYGAISEKFGVLFYCAIEKIGHLNFVCVQSSLTPSVSVAQKRDVCTILKQI